MTTSKTRERGIELLMVAGGPVIWSAHFLLSYATAAVWCARFAGPADSLDPVRIAIAVFTIVALAGIAVVARAGWVRHRLPGGSIPHDDDTPEDRHRFLGYTSFVLAGLSAIATIYSALAAVFIGSCR